MTNLVENSSTFVLSLLLISSKQKEKKNIISSPIILFVPSNSPNLTENHRRQLTLQEESLGLAPGHDPVDRLQTLELLVVLGPLAGRYHEWIRGLHSAAGNRSKKWSGSGGGAAAAAGGWCKVGVFLLRWFLVLGTKLSSSAEVIQSFTVDSPRVTTNLHSFSRSITGTGPPGSSRSKIIDYFSRPRRWNFSFTFIIRFFPKTFAKFRHIVGRGTESHAQKHCPRLVDSRIVGLKGLHRFWTSLFHRKDDRDTFFDEAQTFFL